MQAAAANKEDKALAAAAKAAVDGLLRAKEELAQAEERWVAGERVVRRGRRAGGGWQGPRERLAGAEGHGLLHTRHGRLPLPSC